MKEGPRAQDQGYDRTGVITLSIQYTILSIHLAGLVLSDHDVHSTVFWSGQEEIWLLLSANVPHRSVVSRPRLRADSTQADTVDKGDVTVDKGDAGPNVSRHTADYPKTTAQLNSKVNSYDAPYPHCFHCKKLLVCSYQWMKNLNGGWQSLVWC